MYKHGFKETMSSLPSPISKPAGTQEVVNLYNSVISWKRLSWAHETYLWITAWWPPMSTQHLQVAFMTFLITAVTFEGSIFSLSCEADPKRIWCGCWRFQLDFPPKPQRSGPPWAAWCRCSPTHGLDVGRPWCLSGAELWLRECKNLS